MADGDDKYPGKSRVVQLLDNFKIHGPNGTRILLPLELRSDSTVVVKQALTASWPYNLQRPTRCKALSGVVLQHSSQINQK